MQYLFQNLSHRKPTFLINERRSKKNKLQSDFENSRVSYKSTLILLVFLSIIAGCSNKLVTHSHLLSLTLTFHQIKRVYETASIGSSDVDSSIGRKHFRCELGIGLVYKEHITNSILSNYQLDLVNVIFSSIQQCCNFNRKVYP